MRWEVIRHPASMSMGDTREFDGPYLSAGPIQTRCCLPMCRLMGPSWVTSETCVSNDPNAPCGLPFVFTNSMCANWLWGVWLHVGQQLYKFNVTWLIYGLSCNSWYICILGCISNSFWSPLRLSYRHTFLWTSLLDLLSVCPPDWPCSTPHSWTPAPLVSDLFSIE